MIGNPFVYVGRPEQIREMLTSPIFRARGAMTKRLATLLLGEDSLFTLPYARWLPIRRNLGQVFHLNNMKNYFDVFVQAAKDFDTRVEDHNAKRKKHFEEAKAAGMRTQPTTLLEPVDVAMFAMDFALDVITRALFSKDLKVQNGPGREFSAKFSRLTPMVQAVAMNPLYWLVHPFKYREFRRLVDWFQGFCWEWIAERQASPNNESKDLLGLMLNARDPETGAKFSNGELLAQCATFYFAGHDTTAHTIAWALYEISKHPEVEEKVFNELTAVLGDHDSPTYEEVNKLTYLQWVVKETLRIHPPVATISRTTTEEAEIGGVTIPEGTSVVVGAWAVHCSELFWPEPWRFRPERFSPEESEGRDPYAWVPFSQGERSCIGMNFALMEVRVVLAVLCKKYRLAPSVDLLPYSATLTTNAPADGVFVHFLKREQH